MKKNDFGGGNFHLGDDLDEWYDFHKESLIEERKKVSELAPSIKKEHPDWDGFKCRLYACGRLGIIKF